MPTASGVRAGRAYIDLFADDSKLVRGLRRARGSLMRFGASVTRIGARLFAAAGAAAAPFALAVKAASDMEETMNKFNVVFGKSSDAMREWGDAFAAEVGRGTRQVRDFLAGTQDLFVPLGFEPGAAEEMSKQITRLAVDLASFNNKADSDVLRDLHAALTGSSEVMKKYGVIANETAVKQEAVAQGMDPKKLSDQQKVMLRMAIIMKGTTAAQGDATRSAGSFANQMKRLQGSILDTAAEIGQALIPVLTEWVGKANQIVGAVAEWARDNQDVIATIAQVVLWVGIAGAALVALGTAIVAGGAALGGVATILTTIGTILGAILSPIGLVAAAIGALGAYLLLSTEAGGDALAWLGDKFNDLAGDAIDAFGLIGQALAQGDIGLAAEILWATLKLYWAKGIKVLSDAWIGFKRMFVETAMGAFWGAIAAFEIIWSSLETAWIESIAFLSKTWSKFIAGIEVSWEYVKAAAKKAWAWIQDLFGGESTDVAYKRIEQERDAAIQEIGEKARERITDAERERVGKRSAAASAHEKAMAAIGNQDAAEAREREQEYQAALAAATDELNAAKSAWADTTGAAKDAIADAKSGGAEGPGGPAQTFQDLMDQLKDSLGGATAQAAETEIAGGFNAYELAGAGVGSTMTRVADAAEETADNTKAAADELKNGKVMVTR